MFLASCQTFLGSQSTVNQSSPIKRLAAKGKERDEEREKRVIELQLMVCLISSLVLLGGTIGEQ